MGSLHHVLLAFSLLLVFSVIISKASERFGFPALLLFLGIGMLAGSDGPGGIIFDNAHMAQSIGVVALALILFSGGMETPWRTLRSVVWKGLSLSTLGVVLTAASVGGFVATVLHMSWSQGMLLGAIVSSTDAAAVFSVLKSKNIGLRDPLRPLLEMEAGSNDPMSVFLTIIFVQRLLHPSESWTPFIMQFFQQMGIGALVGVALGKGMVAVINKIKLDYEGLYPVLVFGMALLTYGLTATLDGNGFLAVYLAGLILGHDEFVHKMSIRRFHDGLAWLMQITMFIVLGLLVYPSKLPTIAAPGVMVSLFLIFVARPLSVFVSLIASTFTWREKAMISWVGLRGAAPIILATFPLVAGIPGAETLFNLTFFIVISSVIVQGPLIPWIAQKLSVSTPLHLKRPSPMELDRADGVDARLVDMIVPFNSEMAGRPLVHAGFPAGSLITLICRDDRFIVPTGKTIIQEGDVLSVLVADGHQSTIQTLLSKQRQKELESDVTS